MNESNKRAAPLSFSSKQLSITKKFIKNGHMALSYTLCSHDYPEEGWYWREDNFVHRL